MTAARACGSEAITASWACWRKPSSVQSLRATPITGTFSTPRFSIM
jgi:hypothetical protein